MVQFYLQLMNFLPFFMERARSTMKILKSLAYFEDIFLFGYACFPRQLCKFDVASLGLSPYLHRPIDCDESFNWAL